MDRNKERTSEKYESNIDIFNTDRPNVVHCQETTKAIPDNSEDKSV